MKHTWIQLFHIYQPPSQTKEVVDQVARESYELLISLHERYPHLRTTWNVSGSLLELLEKYGHQALIARIAKLAQSGQIEVTGSAAYHPIIPLISPEATMRQIALQEALIEKHLGIKKEALRTFYFPEMAWSADAGHLIGSLGYSHTALDEFHHPHPTKHQFGTVCIDPSGMHALLRDRTLSKSFPPEQVLTHPDTAHETCVVAHDGELYGHWHKDDRGFYDKLFSSPDFTFMTVSEAIEKQLADNKSEKVTLQSGSWETTEAERANYVAYALWDSPTNPIHQLLWEGERHCESVLRNRTDDVNYASALIAFDKGCASCAWWWASNTTLSAFSPLTWNPTEIIRGATYLVESIRTLRKAAKTDRRHIEAWYHNFTETVWNQHWEYIDRTP